MNPDHQTADTLSLSTPPADAWESGATFQSASMVGERVRLTWLTQYRQPMGMTSNPQDLRVTYSEAEPGAAQVVTVVVTNPSPEGEFLSSFAVVGLAAPEFRLQLEDALMLARLAHSSRGEA